MTALTFDTLTKALAAHVPIQANEETHTTTITLPLGYVVTWGVTPWGAVTCNARRDGRRATMRHIASVQDSETLAMSIAAELRRAS